MMKQYRILIALLFALPALVYADIVNMPDLFKSSPADPYLLFKRLELQAHSFNISGKNYGVLATINKDQYPQLWIVYLDMQHGKGFHFASGQNTLKNQQMAQNQKTSVLYSWEFPDKQHIQIRVTGDVMPMTRTNATDNNVDYLLNPKHILFSLMDKKDKKHQHFFLSYIKQNGKWSMTPSSMDNLPSSVE